MRGSVIALLGACLPTVALAQQAPEIAYDYFHVGYVQGDADGSVIDLKADGLELEASIEAGRFLYVFTGYSALEFDDVPDADLQLKMVGVGARYDFTDAASLYAGIGYIDGDLDVGELSFTDDGLYARAGVRYMPSRRFEVRAGLERIDFDFFGNELAFTLGGTAYLTDVVTVDLGYRSYDDFNFLSLGARFFFGKEKPRGY